MRLCRVKNCNRWGHKVSWKLQLCKAIVQCAEIHIMHILQPLSLHQNGCKTRSRASWYFRPPFEVDVVNIKDVWMMIMAEEQEYSFHILCVCFTSPLPWSSRVPEESSILQRCATFSSCHFFVLSNFNAICNDWCLREITIYCAIENQKVDMNYISRIVTKLFGLQVLRKCDRF